MESPALAMALCVQPQALGALWLDKQAAGRGLLARFAVIAPDSLVGRREIRPKPMRHAVKEGWASLLTGLLELIPIDPGDDERTPIELGQDADEVYEGFQQRVERALGDGDLAARKEWGGKLCGLVLRIALTLHAIEVTGRTEIAAIDEPIGVDVMRAAIAWGEYLVRSEEHARSILVAPADSQRQRELILRIRRLGNEVSVRDWQKSCGHQRNEDARAELQELAELGIGRIERRQAGPNGGRPSEVFALNAAYRAADTTRQNPSDDGGESP
jgi:hypothetical protein